MKLQSQNPAKVTDYLTKVENILEEKKNSSTALCSCETCLIIQALYFIIYFCENGRSKIQVCCSVEHQNLLTDILKRVCIIIAFVNLSVYTLPQTSHACYFRS